VSAGAAGNEERRPGRSRAGKNEISTIAQSSAPSAFQAVLRGFYSILPLLALKFSLIAARFVIAVCSVIMFLVVLGYGGTCATRAAARLAPHPPTHYLTHYTAFLHLRRLRAPRNLFIVHPGGYTLVHPGGYTLVHPGGYTLSFIHLVIFFGENLLCFFKLSSVSVRPSVSSQEMAAIKVYFRYSRFHSIRFLRWEAPAQVMRSAGDCMSALITRGRAGAFYFTALRAGCKGQAASPSFGPRCSRSSLRA
jgi:hypothetical protein